MPEKVLNLAIMFADISGSTKIYEAIGNIKAEKAISSALKKASEFVSDENGIVIKTIGDEIMCRFEDCNQAFNVSNKIHNYFQNNKIEGEVIMSFRIGIHYDSTIISDNGDAFGDCVNVASRLANIARAKQTIFSKELFFQLDPSHQDDSREYDVTSIKGKKEQYTIYEHVWEKSEFGDNDEDLTTISMHATSMHSRISHIEESNHKMELSYINIKEPVQITAKENEFITIGRSIESNIPVVSIMASRAHCLITYRRQKFILVDQSTNGTTVISGSLPPVFIKREEIPLLEEGVIIFGQADGKDIKNIANQKDMLRYKIINS